jgi:hypothetical protein
MKSTMLESNGIRIIFSGSVLGKKVRVTQNGRDIDTVVNFASFKKWAKDVLTEGQLRVAKSQYNRL